MNMTRIKKYHPGPCARLLLCAGGLLLLFGAIRALCAHSSAALEMFRALALRLSALWGGFWGLFPFTVAEILVLAALPALLILLIVSLIRYGRRGIARAFSILAVVLAALLLAFQLLFGVHYQAPPLSQQLRLDMREYSVDELAATMRWLLERVNELAPSVPRRDGVCDFGDFDELTAAVRQGYEALCSEIPLFDTPTRNITPKPAHLMSVGMSYAGITGVYFPFTAEPVVSIDNVDSHLPSTIAHEWAHARGVAPEAECNFVAFLACTAASDTRTQYSGALVAYVYVSNAMYKYSHDDWSRISSGLCDEARLDLSVHSEHWARYESPVQDVGTAVNDAYIRATGQPDGVQSYGKMVDLLISWRLSQ